MHIHRLIHIVVPGDLELQKTDRNEFLGRKISGEA